MPITITQHKCDLNHFERLKELYPSGKVVICAGGTTFFQLYVKIDGQKIDFTWFGDIAVQMNEASKDDKPNGAEEE